MSIRAEDLRRHVVRPALEAVRLWSPDAEELLLGTAAQESHMGTYLVQINGPALGIYQCEPKTHDDIWDNYLRFRGDLAELIRRACRLPMVRPGADAMIWHLRYATVMARCVYLRRPEPLPAAGDIDGQAAYWKQHFNTHLGRGTEDEYRRNYLRFVA